MCPGMLKELGDLSSYWWIQFIVKSGNIIRKSDLFFSFLIKSFQVRGHIWKQLAQIIFRGILNQPNLVFSVNVGAIWWGGSECACLCVFTKGWGSGEFKGFKGIEPNEPPSPKKTLLRDCEQPFSFNKGHLLRPSGEMALTNLPWQVIATFGCPAT